MGCSERKGFSTLWFVVAACIGLLYCILLLLSENRETTANKYDVALQQLNSFSTAFQQAVESEPALSVSEEEHRVQLETYNNRVYTGPIAEAMNNFLDDAFQFYWDERTGCYLSKALDPWGGNYVMTLYPKETDDACCVMPEGVHCASMSIWCTGTSTELREDILLSEVSDITKESVGVAAMVGGSISYIQFHCATDQLPFLNLHVRLR